MSDPHQPDQPLPGNRGPSRGALGCLIGAAATFWGGLLILAVVSVAAFLFLPRLLQGPLDLEGGRLAAVELQPLVHADRPIALGDLTGKVVLLNFWGTWCPPCLKELPHVAELEKQYRGREGFLLLAVSCGRDENEDLEELRRNTSALFVQRGIDLPAYADVNFVTRKAFNQVQAFRGYPTTLLIDRGGTIRKVWVGFDPRMPGQLPGLIEELLAEGR